MYNLHSLVECVRKMALLNWKVLCMGKIKNITPESHRCGVGMCPQVFDAGDGDLIIIGKNLTVGNVPEEVLKHIGAQETAIKIPASLIEGLK